MKKLKIKGDDFNDQLNSKIKQMQSNTDTVLSSQNAAVEQITNEKQDKMRETHRAKTELKKVREELDKALSKENLGDLVKDWPGKLLEERKNLQNKLDLSECKR